MRFLLWIFVLLATIPGVSGVTEIYLDEHQGSQGEVSQIPLLISGAKDIGSLDIQINFDSRILNVTHVESSGLTGSSLFQYSINDGTLAIAIADSRGIDGDGEIAIISIEAIHEGISTLVVEAEANDVNTHIDVIVSTIDGKFTAGSSKVSTGFIALAAIGIAALAGISLMKWKKKE